MDSATVARSLRGSIGMLAMDWLMASSTFAAAKAAGLPEGLPAYVMGRFGGLGECPPDLVVAAAHFWEPTMLRETIDAGRAATTPAVGAAVYTDICRAWGERHLAAKR